MGLLCAHANVNTASSTNTSQLMCVQRACATEPCASHKYTVAPWSLCSVPCGGGRQSRTVRCVATASGDIVENSFCEGLALPAPEAARACNTQACPGGIAAWRVVSTGPCEPPLCGGRRAQASRCECAAAAAAVFVMRAVDLRWHEVVTFLLHATLPMCTAALLHISAHNNNRHVAARCAVSAAAPATVCRKGVAKLACVQVHQRC